MFLLDTVFSEIYTKSIYIIIPHNYYGNVNTFHKCRQLSLIQEGKTLRDSESVQQEEESGQMMYEEECDGFYSSSGQAFIRIPMK